MLGDLALAQHCEVLVLTVMRQDLVQAGPMQSIARVNATDSEDAVGSCDQPLTAGTVLVRHAGAAADADCEVAGAACAGAGGRVVLRCGSCTTRGCTRRRGWTWSGTCTTAGTRSGGARPTAARST